MVEVGVDCEARPFAHLASPPIIIGMRWLPPAALTLLPLLSSCSGPDPLAEFTFKSGDRICLIGNTLADRMQHHGWLETLVQSKLFDEKLRFRNLGYSGDELSMRLRSKNFGSPDEHLQHSQADVVFAFFGYNESHAGDEGLPGFRQQLGDFIDHSLGQQYNGETAPRLVIFSPIAHEDLGSPDLPDGSANNARLQAYSSAMAEVAADKSVPFVDLFTATKELYAREDAPLTINGIHLNELGNRRLAEIIVAKLIPASEQARPEGGFQAEIRSAVLDKNLHWFNRYRTTDGYSIFGARGDLAFVDGQTNREVIDRELEILDVMTANRDQMIWAAAKGEDLYVSDDNTPEFLEVKTNKPGEGPAGAHEFLSGEGAISKMTIAKGMAINLFASEERFPELVNPNQTAMDPQGRLWVSVWPTYPHWQPKGPMNDKLLILPDDDGDGRADRCIVFADDLHNPTGFEFWGGGVIVAQVPDLLFLQDTDGDDRADRRIRLLHGIDSADTHHSINSFVLGPGGDLYFQEGTFHHTQVETPYGPPVRNANAGVYRYDPRRQDFEVYSAYNFANPHGHVFDRWGQDFVTDGTGSQPYLGASFSGRSIFPQKHGRAPQVYQQRTRPCPGTIILSSSHFPEEVQGNWLVGNVIGFQGILQYQLADDGSGFTAEEVEPIVFSSDPNFRPTDMEIGKDGALYFSEWQNPIIGHMQHNLRDPSRDKLHGRVYRVTYPERDLLVAKPVAGQSTADLVRLLAEPDDPLRYRARIELSDRPSDEVIAALQSWMNGLSKDDPEYEHHMAEALWVHQAHNRVDLDLLQTQLRSQDPRARAAATRVLTVWREHVPEFLELLAVQVRDEHPRVRLEAVRACSFVDDSAAAEIALQAVNLPLDRFLSYTLNETIKTLRPQWLAALGLGEAFADDNPKGQAYLIERVGVRDLVKLPRSELVCKALLSRAEISEGFRRGALRVLAEKNGSNEMAELIAALERADAEHSPGLEDLCSLLRSWDAEALMRSGSALIAMSSSGQSALLRESAFAAWIRAEGSPQTPWQAASASLQSTQDVLRAIAMIEDPAGLGSLYGQVRTLMFELPDNLRSQTEKAAEGSSPGVSYAYFESDRFADVSIESISRMQAKRTGTLAGFGKDIPGSRGDRFALSLRAGVQVPEDGNYRFYLASDDGSRLYLDDRMVIDNDGLHGLVEKSVEVSLRTGLHSILVTYFDNGGDDALSLQWSGPGFERRELQPELLPSAIVTDTHRAAVEAMANLPVRSGDRFRDFAGLVESGQQRWVAIKGLLRISREDWPTEGIQALASELIRIAKETPLELRNSEGYQPLFELGQEIVDLLPAEEAASLREQFAELAPLTIRIRTVPAEMRYDRREFTVVAGRPVRIIFENPDKMQHNLLIVQPGAVEEVGRLGDAMGAEGIAKDYIPDSDKILFKTRLISYGESVILDFVAPSEPGDYGVVCTFPEHWRLMQGLMRVVR